MAKVYGALESAQFEWFTTAGRPSAVGNDYRVIWNTDLQKMEISNGTTWVSEDVALLVYTEGTLPAAAPANQYSIAFLTDSLKFKVSTGTAWTNVGGTIDFYTSGTLPAAAASNINKIVWLTDTQQIKISDGSTWGTVAGSAGSSFVNVVNSKIYPLYTYSDNLPYTVAETDLPGDSTYGDNLFLSADGKLLMTVDQTPGDFCSIYEVSGAGLVKTASPTDAVVALEAIALSPCGQYLVTYGDNHIGDKFYIYRKSMGTAGVTWTRLAQPAGTFENGYKIAWSPDSKFFALCTGVTPFLYIFKRTANNVFTALPTVASIPDDQTLKGLEFSPNGKYLAVGIGTSPYFHVYSILNDTFTKLAAPAVLPTTTASFFATVWHPGGEILSIGAGPTEFMNYTVIGNTVTALPQPAVLPSAQAETIKYHPYGNKVFLGYQGSAQTIESYTISGTTFTKDPVLSNVPPAMDNVRGIAFSNNGRYMYVSGDTAPKLRVYETADAAPDLTDKNVTFKYTRGESGGIDG